MEAQFYGANCVRLQTKKVALVIDDNLATLGQKSITKDDDVALFTLNQDESVKAGRLVFAKPGEYEVADISIQGIAAKSHMDTDDKMSATIFRVVAGDVRAVVMGHVSADLTDEQLEAIGVVDVLFIPVGNHGYTLDATEALKLIKKIEPKLVVPTHYADTGLKYEVPQVTLDEALKDLAMEPKEKVDKLKLKAGELGDTTQLVVLERS